MVDKDAYFNMAAKRKQSMSLLNYFKGSAPKKQSPNKDENGNSENESELSDSVSESNKNESVNLSGDLSENPSTSSASKNRPFHKKWLNDFKWLNFNENANAMTCTLCLRHKKVNSLTNGKCNNLHQIVREGSVPRTW